MKTLLNTTRRLALLLAVTILTAASIAAATKIENTVTIADPNSPVIRVATVISGVNQAQLELGLPNWTPGYYTTEDYAKHVARLVFTDQSGRKLYHRKRHDSIWIVNTTGATSVKIEFEYTADELDLNQSRVFANYAILNPINFAFYIKDHTLDVPESITFKLPQGWEIASPLTSTRDATTFSAENYDVLVDSPTLVGQIDVLSADLRGVPHRFAYAPKGAAKMDDLKKLTELSMKVIDEHTKMFGEIPYKHYIVINLFEGTGGGGSGLEHLNSYLGILSKPVDGKIDPESIIGLTSHEFFHAFNVKRIRPAEMWPYRYHERNYSQLLWVSEGITDYYTDRGLLRAGLIKPEAYLNAKAQLMAGVQSVEAAKFISAEEASINTWLGGIAGEGQPFAVDYYSRGSVLGLLLDLSIRNDSNGFATLDDVMRALYTEFYKKDRGFTTEDLIAIINRLTKKDYREFFERFVSGTDELPYDRVLAYVGLRMETKANKVPRMGIQTDGGSSPENITAVVPDSAADRAGVKSGDALIGIGNIPADSNDWSARFRKEYANKEGQPVTLYLMRDGKPVFLEMKVALVDVPETTMQRLGSLTALQSSNFEAWANGK